MMKRILCIRFPNWPIQSLRQYQRTRSETSAAVALHTAPVVPTDERAKKSDLDADTRFLRSLYPTAGNGPAVVAVSMDAWQRGVRPGMPLAEARSMAAPPAVPIEKRRARTTAKAPPVLPAVEFFEWQPHRDRETLKSVAELTRRYAPIVGLDDVPMPDSLLLDITGCAPLFGGEAGLAEALWRDLRKAGWSSRIAIAESVSAAWALTHADVPKRAANPPVSSSTSRNSEKNLDSRRGVHRPTTESNTFDLPIQIIPNGHLQQELRGLPVSASRVELSDLEILSHLGIRTLGQLLSLPIQDLPSRLSAAGIVRIQQLAGSMEEFIEPLPEANPVAAAWSSDEPGNGMLDVQHVLEHLTQQIAEQLVRRRMACSSVTCRFRCTDGSFPTLVAGVVKPTQSAALLHEVLCLRIETEATHAAITGEVAPHSSQENLAKSDHAANTAHAELSPSSAIERILSQPFLNVSMVASVGPLPVAKQKDLFSPEEHIVPQEELATLISRLSGRLGPSAVATVRNHADPRPEFAERQEPVLPQEHAAQRQSALDVTLRNLTDPLPSMHPSGVDQTSGHVSRSEVLPRPVRLLPEPMLIPGSESKRTFPLQLMIAGQTFLLDSFSSPERIQTAWWTDQPCHRDYYQVTCRAGSRLWLFRDLQSSQWFLHGVFD